MLFRSSLLNGYIGYLRLLKSNEYRSAEHSPGVSTYIVFAGLILRPVFHAIAPLATSIFSLDISIPILNSIAGSFGGVGCLDWKSVVEGKSGSLGGRRMT